MKKSTKKPGLKKFQIAKLHQTHPVKGGGDGTNSKSKCVTDTDCKETKGG